MTTPEMQRTKTGRKWIWIAVVVAVGWLVISSFAGPLSGKLSEVQKNDNASFLPASSESTVVADEAAKFSDSDSLPELVVFSRADGGALTKDDFASIQQFVKAVPTLPVAGGEPMSTYLDGQPIVPIPSEDGAAALVNVGLNSEYLFANTADGESVLGAVTEALRTEGAKYPSMQVNVTGPGGLVSDLVKVFGAIDTTLLGATALVVAVILILVYRSPFIWIIPLFSAGIALSTASAVVYLLAKNEIVVLNGQSQGILTVLVFGAGTDYALLLVSRYREELHRFESHIDAMKAAWRGVVEPIVASAATVSIGLMCLLLSDLNSNKSTGPVAAAGILAALVVMLTLLPALLVVPSSIIAVLLYGVLFAVLAIVKVPLPIAGVLALVIVVLLFVFGARARRSANPPKWAFFAKWPAGRWAFWPKTPKFDSHDEKLSGVWSKIAGGVAKRPRRTWVLTGIAMVILAGFTVTLKADGLTTTDSFTGRPDSVIGQEVLADHFPGGLGSPTVVIANEGSLEQVLSTTTSTPGVEYAVPFTGAPAGDPNAQSAPPKVVDGKVQVLVTLSDPADSPAAEETVQQLRTELHAIAGADALVGGTTAVNVDVNAASIHDRNLIIPIVLLVIFVILILLLRAVVAPLLLIGTVVLSYFATLGLCAIFFNHVFDFAGADPSFPLFTFVFLVALGVDYNIFLMTRVREESITLGTRPGIVRGLTVTGGVITSAGIVLAATFLVLGVLPLVPLRQVGFAVALGVILDTFVIRSTLVPALSYDIGKKIWWPSKLAKAAQPPELVSSKTD